MGVVLALAGAGTPAHAQAGAWRPRLQLDNDTYNFWLSPGARPDEEYSNGVRASIEGLSAPWWSRKLGGGHAPCDPSDGTSRTCIITEYAIGQDLYTPNLDSLPFSFPEWERQRPYAGYLYVSGTSKVAGARSFRSIEVQLGVTGPPSGAQGAQAAAHKLFRYDRRREVAGWETQIGFEPGLLVGWKQRVLLGSTSYNAKRAFDVAPTVAVSLGNILTEASAGADARLGANLSHPWHPQAWGVRKPWEFNLVAGARVRAVARDISLDGNTVDADRRVERKRVVGEWTVGAELRLLQLRVGYRAVTRSREYATGPGHHSYSSMSAAWEFVP